MTKDLEYYMGLPYRVEVVEDKEARCCPSYSPLLGHTVYYYICMEER